MATVDVKQVKAFTEDLKRFMMVYHFALKELSTKVDILNEEFQLVHAYNPIEHTKTRLKSAESIIRKARRKGIELNLESIKREIKDIAGMRIICSFISDIYWISDMLQNQADLEVIGVKDYIQHPKPNGYQSLHVLLEVPVFLSDHEDRVPVELQIRTIAMDFWASLEHKIYYNYKKYNDDQAAVPERLLAELKEAAVTATSLDRQMERIHQEISVMKERKEESGTADIFSLMK